MKKFASGFNNFFVGLVSGLLLPVIILSFLVFLSLDKIERFVENKSFVPLYEHGQQTLTKVDELISTLDDKIESQVDQIDLHDIKALAPLKNVNLLPEFKLLTSTLSAFQDVKDDSEKQKLIANLKLKLQGSLKGKFSVEKSKQLVNNLVNIAELLANKDTLNSQATPQLTSELTLQARHKVAEKLTSKTADKKEAQ